MYLPTYLPTYVKGSGAHQNRTQRVELELCRTRTRTRQESALLGAWRGTRVRALKNAAGALAVLFCVDASVVYSILLLP
jgi:hypothetical protein